MENTDEDQVVLVPSIQTPIQPAPGFQKKQLADVKLDILGLCGFGCAYCSSNWGNYLRTHQGSFANLTESQLGQRLLPSDEPSLTFHWTDFDQRLEEQLRRKPRTWGAGKTLVFSMLTDGFSPLMVTSGATRRVLETLVTRTSFRIRVLTKNAIVGTDKWLQFFAEHRDRFVVGLTIAMLDDDWARRFEAGTSAPTARLRALHRLQEAEVPTYVMICPIFPEAVPRLDELVQAVHPDRVEHVWAEAFNDRGNWKKVRARYPEGSPGDRRLTELFGPKSNPAWSRYATDLYFRFRDLAQDGGWLPRLRYMLYEGRITTEDAHRFQNLDGLLLQGPKGGDGRSKHAVFRDLQIRRSAPSTGLGAIVGLMAP